MKAYDSRAEQELFSIFDKATREKGILHVLKNGIRSIDANFKVCLFKVHNPHNTTADERYKLNQWQWCASLPIQNTTIKRLMWC